MGLQIMKMEPKMGFFASNGRDHHEIAAMEVGPDAPLPPPHAIGLPHIAFRLRDEAHLRAAYDDLKAHGVKIITAINHGVTKSVYFLDRDGNQLEVYRGLTTICSRTRSATRSTSEASTSFPAPRSDRCVSGIATSMRRRTPMSLSRSREA
jgi:hypothetical protein